MIFIHANILQAFDPVAVGTKVTDRSAFLACLADAVEGFDFDAQTTPGQGFVSLPESAKSTVSAGVGRRVNDASAYVLRSWRGRVEALLRRERAAEVDGVAAVVYTADAYLSDPEVGESADEVDRIKRSGATHVIVAVLAFAGPKAPLSPHRLVSNLAGGNKDALKWSADEIREKAREVDAYDAEWCVVGD